LKTINTNKVRRFVGKVIVSGQTVYIDTSDGTGYTEVLKHLDWMVHRFASSNSHCFASLEDAKQEVCVAMLEGITRYDRDKGAGLSTFLFRVVHNRMKDHMRKDIRGRTRYVVVYDDDWSHIIDRVLTPHISIELSQRTKSWDAQWKQIMVRIYVEGDSIANVAKDYGYTPWGLTRAIRKKLKEARKV
jgi:RNA polymerase sigma factor (sigma-70 family)